MISLFIAKHYSVNTCEHLEEIVKTSQFGGNAPQGDGSVLNFPYAVIIE